MTRRHVVLRLALLAGGGISLEACMRQPTANPDAELHRRGLDRDGLADVLNAQGGPFADNLALRQAAL